MLRFLSLLFAILLVRILLFYSPQNFQKQEKIIGPNPLSQNIFMDVKIHIKQSYQQALDQRQASLLMGIVFGEKDLPKSENKKFIDTGVIHVIAASGMNVTLFTAFVGSVFVLFLKRQHAAIATALTIIFYTALADFQPSIVRAAIMAIIAVGAQVTGRQNTSLFALLITANFMILWDPSILTSIGFILSFAATAGIILIEPLLSRGIFKKAFFEEFRVTIAAQISTTPIILFFFGTYSPISILANILVLWTIAPIMVLGMAAAISGLIIQALALPFVYLTMPLLSYFTAVIDLLASLSSPIKIQNPPIFIVIGYYLILASGLLLVKRQKE